MQLSAASVAAQAPRRPAAPEAALAQVTDLTRLAVAQTAGRALATAGAALGHTTAELTGLLVDISA